MQNTNLLLLLPLLFFTVIVTDELVPVQCFSNNTACDGHDDSIIVSHGGVMDLSACRLLCYDKEQCSYFTYFGANSFPFSEVCSLFTSCDTVHSCEDCVSETRECYQSCSEPNYGKIDENLIEMIADVQEEVNCKLFCVASSGCSYYTYFLVSDPNTPRLCILLSYLMDPVRRLFSLSHRSCPLFKASDSIHAQNLHPFHHNNFHHP